MTIKSPNEIKIYNMKVTRANIPLISKWLQNDKTKLQKETVNEANTTSLPSLIEEDT